jgi:hypothetical protein
MEVMTICSLTAGVPGVSITHCCPVARGQAPPQAQIYSRPGELCCVIIRSGSFPCPDTSLHLLTVVGADFFIGSLLEVVAELQKQLLA